MKFSEKELDDPVTSFVTGELSYHARTEGRLGIDIVKCYTRTPEIEDPENYLSYMWVNSVQGYYVLEQAFEKGEPQDWRLIRQIIPEEPDIYFFEKFDDQFLDYVRVLRCPRSKAEDSRG